MALDYLLSGGVNMKIGLLTVLFGKKPLEAVLKDVTAKGIEAIELGAGAFPGSNHLDVPKLLRSPREVDRLKGLCKDYGVIISALSVHGNPVHPNKKIAKEHHRLFENACKLAKLLGVRRVNTFSGCPGDSISSKYPNWVTCSWPPDFLEILDYQWNKVLIPYWKKTVPFAKKYGVNKICLEMHPGFCVHNPETLLKLRAAAGKSIGANFDPSHLWWQGMDPVEALKALKGAVYHFHVKDCHIDPHNTQVNGVLDTKHYGDVLNRSWIFRTVGYGHGADVWTDIFSTLIKIGYDDVVSIEHEDGLMSVDEGLTKAIEFLQTIVMKEKPGEMWWA
jgi:sugar phosphate isomerase/epimerase